MTRPKMLPNAREAALRHVERERIALNGQAAPDAYFAQKAAKHVGATTEMVLQWMRGR